MKRSLAIGAMLLLGSAGLPEGIAWAGEKFVLRASAHRTKLEAIEIGDVEGHRFTLSEWIGVAFNAAGSGFLDAAQYVFKASNDVGKTSTTLMGYKIFTMQDGSKAFGRYEGKPLAGGAEGTFQFMGGTGKLEGLKGGGTWRSWLLAPDLLWDRLEGEYELPK